MNEKTYMLFVSKGDTLVQASFVTNEEGQYHYESDTEEIAIGDPHTGHYHRNEQNRQKYNQPLSHRKREYPRNACREAAEQRGYIAVEEIRKANRQLAYYVDNAGNQRKPEQYQ